MAVFLVTLHILILQIGDFTGNITIVTVK